MKAAASILILLLVASRTTIGQEFVNLDFEDAVVELNDPVYGFLDWDLAVPGWGHSSGVASDVVYYRQPHLGMDRVYFLVDPTSTVGLLEGPLAGQFSMAFSSSGLLDPAPDAGSAFLSQTGDIPTGTKSVWMLATGPFAVFVDDVEIPMWSQGGITYAGDVSQFAGATAELKIMNTSYYPHDYAAIDNLAFSPVYVPEPNTAVLWSLALGALFWQRRIVRQGDF